MLELNAVILNKVYPRWIVINIHFQHFRDPANSPAWHKDI